MLKNQLAVYFLTLSCIEKQLEVYKPSSCSTGNTTANASPTKKHLMGFVLVPNTGGGGN